MNRRRRLQLRGAASLLLIQSILMGASVFVGLLVLLALGVPQATITDRVEVFGLSYLNDNLYSMMAMSGVFAALRIIGAIGLLRNRMWGLMLSLGNCVVTLVLMTFLLPAGLVDGVLSGVAFLLLILVRWGRDADGCPREIVARPRSAVGS